MKVTRKETIKVFEDMKKGLYPFDPTVYLDIAINPLEIDERYELEYEQIEPCDDAISREPFTNSTICEGFSCEECSFNRKDKGGCILEERVMKLPPVTPQPKTGHWTHLGGDEWCCSACGKVIYTEGSWEKPKDKFCKECGAKMQAERSGKE